MGKCGFCGKQVDLPFQCPFCKGDFCIEHRLPENHSCINAPARTPLGHWKAKKAPTVRIEKIPSPFSPITEGKPRKRRNLKKIGVILLAVILIGALLWYAPTIISFIQNLSSQPTNSSDGSYTTLTLLKSSSSSPNFTSLTFGDIDYFFDYSWQGYLLVSNSLLETESYRPTNGSVFRDIGIEIKVSEAYSDHIVLFVKPTVQDYLAQSSFTKLTIAQGQYQTVNFSGNEYTIGYLQNPPYYVNKLIVMTPLLESREYYAFSSQIINCDLGLEIRVYKATSQYIIIFVKPSY